MPIKKTDKKEIALALYMNTNKTQEEIAGRVGVSRKTIGEWIDTGNWETLKAAKGSGRQQLIASFYAEIKGIQDLANSENRRLSSQEVLNIKNLTKSIEELDKKLSLDKYIEVAEEFTNWLYSTDPEQARKQIGHLDRFIDIKASEVK